MIKVFLFILHVASFCHGLTIVVTGTSQGIGLDAATRLIKDGHTVIHANRSMERSQTAVKAAGGGIPMECNLASLKSIRAFASQVQQQTDKSPAQIDVLCCNAGIAPSTKAKTPSLSEDGFEECIATNHLGHFLLVNLLKENLAQSETARLVVTASSVHDPEAPGGNVGAGATVGDLSGLGVNLQENNNNGIAPTMIDGNVEYDGAKVYMDSKLCNVLFCREALNRLPGISVRSFNPGFIPSSGLFRAPRKDNWIGATAFTVVAGLIGFAVPVEVGGARLAYMATASDDEVPSGSYYSAEVTSRASSKAEGFDLASVSQEGSDEELSAKLWEASAKIVGL